jgi:hypothetical protein
LSSPKLTDCGINKQTNTHALWLCFVRLFIGCLGVVLGHIWNVHIVLIVGGFLGLFGALFSAICLLIFRITW